MNVKIMKKIVKRQTALRRARRQTARRRNQLDVDKSKEQRAQDIYETLGARGEVARSPKKREYALKDYDYNMFEYGDPYAIRISSSSTAPMNQRQKRAKRQADEKARINATIRVYMPEKKRDARRDRGEGERTHTRPQRKGSGRSRRM